MPSAAAERSTAASGTADGWDVGAIVRTYLAAAGGDPHQALADAVADALRELDAYAVTLRERDRIVSAGYVRAGRPASGQP